MHRNPLKPSKNRSRRLRKKLHIGEFQQLYFDRSFYLLGDEGCDEEAYDCIFEFAESHNLSCFAGCSLNKSRNLYKVSTSVSGNNYRIKVDESTIKMWVEWVHAYPDDYEFIHVSSLADAWN